jgi:cathepsin B
MKTILLLILITFSLSKLSDPLRITPEHIEEIRKNAEFQVYDYESHPFKNLTPFEIQRKFGALREKKHTLGPLPTGNLGDLPENFLVHDKWPQCVHKIRDQQNCGSCWAFAASEVLSDRLCIASGNKIDQVLSPQDLVSCEADNFGCDGGWPNLSWAYMQKTGIVSDTCFPYVSGGGVTKPCSIKDGKCTDGSAAKKYFAKEIKEFKSIAEIKEDIFNNGPVETYFTVYGDFIYYSGGIYKRSSEEILGAHAIKIVGWGREDGTDYWVVANSWGPNWGEKGHFRIAIGNCCEFEDHMIAGLADVERSQ